jgi:hypothetical protein
MAAGRRGRLTRSALALLWLVGPLAQACASELTVVNGRLEHGQQGYSVALPSPSSWKRVSVEGAVVAFRGPGRTLMSLQSRCGRPLAHPQILARELMIGLPPRHILEAGPVAVGPWQGWTQTFETQEKGEEVRVKTVTLVARRCIFDWVLSSNDGFASAAPDFDAWWQSFELQPGETP